MRMKTPVRYEVYSNWLIFRQVFYMQLLKPLISLIIAENRQSKWRGKKIVEAAPNYTI